jgi:hypothetical protein
VRFWFSEQNKIISQILNNINILRWLLWGRNSIVKYYLIHLTPQLVNLGSTFSSLILRYATSRRFLFSPMPWSSLGLTQPPIQRVPGILLRGIKRPGRDAYYPPWSSAKFKNEWSHTAIPPHPFMVCTRTTLGCNVRRPTLNTTLSLLMKKVPKKFSNTWPNYKKYVTLNSPGTQHKAFNKRV